jgi:hypothetical protein
VQALRFLLLLVVAAVLSSCLHPRVEVYEAALEGSVSDAAGRPIQGALVERVGDDFPRTDPNAAIQSTETDATGAFRIPELKRVAWWRSPSDYAMGWTHCYAFIQVQAEGYSRFNSSFADPSLTRDANASIGCNGARFAKQIVLVAEKQSASVTHPARTPSGDASNEP